MRKLYYILSPGYVSRSISSWYNTISRKVQGIIRNDDQSLSPVIPLVSILFCRSKSLEMFVNIFSF